MRKDRHIRAIEETTADAPVDGEPLALAGEDHLQTEDLVPIWDDSLDEPAPSRRLWPVALAALAILAIAGWTGFFAWTNRSAMLGGASPDQWVSWIGQWATPVLLIAMAWLIAMRSSAREASRFGDAARLLAQESAALEARLVHVNRELSLAREFLAAQSRELDYVGRSAAERISEHAGKLQSLVSDNGAQVDAIAQVSTTALANMSELRDNLPVIANSARDVSNQIGGAGRSAKAQLADLVAGFERLNEFGQASERQVTSLRSRIDTALEDLSAFVATLDANNAARAETLREEVESARQELAVREGEVLDAIRARAAALREELLAAHDARELEEAATLAAMRGRLASFTQQAHEAAAEVRAGERSALDSWDAQVTALKQRLEQTLGEIAELDRKALDTAREKLEALTAEAERVDARMLERDEEFQARATARDAEFSAAADRAFAALGERERGLQDTIAERDSALARSAEQAFQHLSERAEAFDSEVAARHEAQVGHAATLSGNVEALATRIAEIEGHIASVSARSAEAEKALANSAEHFATTVGSNRKLLAETEAAVNELPDASVRLLELIQGAAQHSRTELPAAIAGFEEQLGTARANSSQIRDALVEARQLGDELGAALTDMHGAGAAAIGELDAFRSRLTGTAEEQTRALADLRQQIAAAGVENRALAESVAGELAGAVERLRETTTSLLGDFESVESERIAALADRIGEQSGAAIDRAVEARTEATVSKLDEATAQATEASREAIAQMRDQLARVHELTVNLETRAARAREQVEEQVDNDFSRRMALITESLNSNSIDIARALSTEVTDTAWAAYLKGDRGVFTRRAVRLIGNGEARSIGDLYETDHEFRDHVSRYIHDFEAMLRTMLSTRDGHSLGVTLLSSDMGKLYVTLAQAIQRFRQ